ncbi:MAG TPA: hypothetical protein PLV04_02640, partial [Phenylobacterium sp.]|nr:hypothetical protein [Phenylobacterium sp.]
MASPMHQFEIQPVLTLPTVNVPGIGAIDLSINNSIMSMLSAAAMSMAMMELLIDRSINNSIMAKISAA